MLIVITGASKGIGFEMVKQLAGKDGYTILAISRNTDRLGKLKQERHPGKVYPLSADITKPEDRKKIASFIKTFKKPVDVLVNNAGQILKKPFGKISGQELYNVYNTNVFAPFALIQALLPLLNKKEHAHIVNIGSMGGFQGSSRFAGLSAYSSSKSALAGLSECLAEELKPLNISVNCLALGAVQTEMLTKAFPGYKAPLQASDMASFICDFAVNGHRFFNGKVIPVSSSTP